MKAEEKLQEEMATLSQFDTELKELERLVKEKNAVAAQADLDIQTFQHDIQVLTTEMKKAANKVAELETLNEWIEHEKEWVLHALSYPMCHSDKRISHFGKPGTQYDFNSTDINALRQKSEELMASQEGLKKKVNTKVMNMIDRYS